jgi:hypothetical protein
MREAIHRKSSLLNMVKQKYEQVQYVRLSFDELCINAQVLSSGNARTSVSPQIQLSIAALAEGTKGVDGATAELHSTTYKLVIRWAALPPLTVSL